MSELKENSSYQEYNINNIEQGMESITISEFAHYKNQTLSDEINYNEEGIIVKPPKYAKPKYREVQKTYKVLKPIIKETVTLPVKRKEKVKIIDPVYNKTIIVNGENGYNNIIEYDQQNYPLPTQSTIQNLCKESVIGSENYYRSYQVPKDYDPESNPVQTQSTTQKESAIGSENYYSTYQESKNYVPESMLESRPLTNDENYENNLEANIVIPKETYQSVYEDNLKENQEQNNYQEQYYKQEEEYKSSKNYLSKNQENKFQSANANEYHLSKPQMSNVININNENKNIKSDNLKIEYQHFNISKRPNNEYQKSKIEHQQNIIINNNKNNNFQSSTKENNKKSKQITESHISHVQIKKLPNVNEQDKNKYQSKIYHPNLFENKNNKNFDIQNNIEEEDDIPKPTVYEGESLEKSEIKEENKNMDENNNYENNNDDINNIFIQSAEQEPERHYSKIKKIEAIKFIENLPVDQTEIMSKSPSIDISKIQKINMTQDSEKFSFNPSQQSQQYNQSKLEQSKFIQKSLYPSKMQMSKQSKIGQPSIRVKKIESNSNYFSKNNNYNYNIPRDNSIAESNNINQPNINQVKESKKYQQAFQHSNINDMDDIQEYNNYEGKNINNKTNNAIGQMSQKSYIPGAKSSFPTASYCGSTIISKSKIPLNPFEGEDNIEKSSVPLYENKVKVIKK